jgi:threonine synthase
MRFTDELGGLLGLLDAAARGYPAVAGFFSPKGDADLRPAVYAPESGYADAASSAIAVLFPEDVDPLMSERLAARAFCLTPACRDRGEGILLADYTAGPSASAADAETAFLAGILAAVARRSGPRMLLADGSGWEGAALSEAIAGIHDLRLVLLYPEGKVAGGIKSQRLAREGGQVSLVSVRGDRVAVDRLIREAAGTSVAGMAVTAAGPANPARFAARIVVLAATFAILRKGTSGDLFMGIRAGDGLGLAACLWAWRLGLPLTGIVLSASERGVLGLDPSGKSLVERFDAERPGVIRSLALLQSVDREAALLSREALSAEGGPALDLASAMTLVAAERALDAGLRGHTRIVIPLGGDPAWDLADGSGAGGAGASSAGPGGGLRDARVDLEIAPALSELGRALTA